MIRENWRLFNILNGFADLILNVGAVLLAYVTRFIILPDDGNDQAYVNYVIVGAIYAIFCTLTYSMLHLYERNRNKSYIDDMSSILRANVVGILFLGILLFFVRFVDFSRLALFFIFLYSSVLVVAKHAAVRLLFRYYRSQGYNRRFVLLVGTGALAQDYVDSLQNASYLGLEVRGYVCCRPQETLEDATCIGEIGQLEELIGSQNPDQVVIALSEEDISYTRAAIECCNTTGTRFSVVPFFSEYVFSASSPTVENIGNVQTFDFSASPLDLVGNKLLKRLMDIVLSFVMLVVLSPIMLLAAIGIKLSSRGPVFFMQERVGLNKDTFKMYKFRSMRVNDAVDKAWSSKGDPRITPFGKFLRKSNIDELPQLLNVLKGDMSLIGPRPEIPYHVGHFKNEIPYYMGRHQIHPGLTGWAQVNGYRGDTSIEKRVKCDLYYIYNWSLLFDIKILLKTVFSLGE